MALFRRTTRPAFASAPLQAAAGLAGQAALGYASWSVGADIERAQTIPVLARAQNLLVSLIAGLDLREYSLQWTGDEYEEVHVPGESWLASPSPGVTRQFFIGSIVGDLFWHGRAFAAIVGRYNNGYAAQFQWIPAGSVSTPDQVGPVWYGPSKIVQFNGLELDTANIVQFIAPTPGVLYTGSRMIDIAIRLDTAARRFATSEIAAGYLQVQPGGEPMSSDDLADMASAWSTARQSNAIGALNEYVRFVEFNADPSKLQLTEGRQYSALELSRVAGIPPWLLGIGVSGSFTYQNSQDAMRQLWLLGARPIMTTIEETLSMQLPRGRHVRFDVDDIIGEADVDETIAPVMNDREDSPT